MDRKTFSAFSDIRKESYSIIKDYRESFVKDILKKHGIVYSNDIHRRAFQELMESHKAEIYKDEKLNRDIISINGKIVAYWNRDVELVFIRGNLMCRIYHWIEEQTGALPVFFVYNIIEIKGVV